MTDQDLIRVCAELDGWAYEVRQLPKFISPGNWGKEDVGGYARGEKWILKHKLPNYLESYDAIIPVINKMDDATFIRFVSFMLPDEPAFHEVHTMSKARAMYYGTPRQLTIAIVKAVGKFKE